MDETEPGQEELTPSRLDTPRFDSQSGLTPSRFETPTRFEAQSGLTPSRCDTPRSDTQSGCATPRSYDYASPVRAFNPVAPPELKDEAVLADIIKGTGISKSWVFHILIDLLKEIEKYSEDEAEESEAGMNISDEQQVDLGMLWDVSMDPDVARFLMDPESQCNTESILLSAIMKSRAPRVNEVCIGILGNLCCFPEHCETLSQNESFMKVMCFLLSNVEFDGPTLREALRAVLVCIKNPVVSQQWIEAMLTTPDLLKLIMFVLESALEEKLLTVAGELLDTLMDNVDELCEAWASPELVENIVVAIKQIGERKKNEVKPFLHIFQLLSTSQPGVLSLRDHSERVTRVLTHWLRQVCDEDLVIVDDHLSAINSVISVLNLLLSVEAVAHYLSTKPGVFKDMVKVLESLYTQNQQCENPATLPGCLFPRPKKRSSPPACEVNREPTDPSSSSTVDNRATNRMSWESLDSEELDEKGDGQDRKGQDGKGQEGEEQDSSEQQAEEEHCTGSSEVREELSSWTLGYRTLMEVLQEYFRKFFNSLKLPDRSHRKSTDEKKHHVHRPEYYPVLKQLDKFPRRHISYLVSVLVYNIPPSDVVGDGTCPEGWLVVDHLRYLCHLLHLDKAKSLLEDVVATVKLTAGVSK